MCKTSRNQSRMRSLTGSTHVVQRMGRLCGDTRGVRFGTGLHTSEQIVSMTLPEGGFRKDGISLDK
jgi:hypothetical protein